MNSLLIFRQIIADNQLTLGQLLLLSISESSKAREARDGKAVITEAFDIV
jgi:hypothetical protein